MFVLGIGEVRLLFRLFKLKWERGMRGMRGILF
jgi:hypothetical protein